MSPLLQTPSKSESRLVQVLDEYLAAVQAGQAPAHLHHTNIVPVHAIGCERGVHYYAMQYIEGPTLAAVIGDLRRHAGLAPSLPSPNFGRGESGGSPPAAAKAPGDDLSEVA